MHRRGRTEGLGKDDSQQTLLQPGNRCRLVGVASRDQERVVGATAEAHIDAVGADLDARTGMDELAEQRAGPRLGVVASTEIPNSLRQKS